jgi:hypothetical protein
VSGSVKEKGGGEGSKERQKKENMSKRRKVL